MLIVEIGAQLTLLFIGLFSLSTYSRVCGVSLRHRTGPRVRILRSLGVLGELRVNV